MSLTNIFKNTQQQPLEDLSPSDTAVLLIDVQKRFDSTTANRIAYRISSMANHFRDRGLPIYGVHVTFGAKLVKEIDFLHYTPAPMDTLVQKFHNSAFRLSVRFNNGDDTHLTQGEIFLEDVLKMRRVRNLIVCGGYFSHCLHDTVIDALKNFNVYVVEDLTTDSTWNGLNDSNNRDSMAKKGAVFVKAVDILRRFPKNTQEPQTAMPPPENQAPRQNSARCG